MIVIRVLVTEVDVKVKIDVDVDAEVNVGPLGQVLIYNITVIMMWED